MNTEDDMDPFTEELRLDLPRPADEARVRVRLVSAGVLAGASVIAPGAATAATGTSLGIFAKIAALPLLAKVGASVVVASLAAVPLVTRASGGAEAPVAQARAFATVAALADAPAPDERAPAPSPVEEPATTPSEPAAPKARELAPRATVTPAPRTAETSSPAGPSVGSFALAPEPVDEGTLRAETALMERALAELQRGDLPAARRDLAAHASQFPNGHLAPERRRALERMLGKERKP